MPASRLRLVASLLPWLAGPDFASAEVARVDVDPARTFQTIDGFGVNFNGTYFRETQKPAIDLICSADLRGSRTSATGELRMP